MLRALTYLTLFVPFASPLAATECLDLIHKAREQERGGQSHQALLTYFEALACNPNVIEGQFTGQLELCTPLAPTEKAWQKGAALKQKTVLVYAVKGHGDSLQFARFVKTLASAGPKRIYFAVPGSLKRLFVDSFSEVPVVEVRELSEAAELAKSADLHAPLLSLPYLLDVTEISGAPYLRATKTLPLALDHRFVNVGVVFSGDAKHPHNADRSFTPNDLKSLAGLTHVRFYSLQPGSEDLVRANKATLDVSDVLLGKLKDYADTAAAIAQLDAVISADTSVSHLAAALGAKTFVPLSYRTDLRYAGRARVTDWYRGMVLLRQTKQGEWQKPMAELREEIARLKPK